MRGLDRRLQLTTEFCILLPLLTFSASLVEGVNVDVTGSLTYEYKGGDDGRPLITMKMLYEQFHTKMFNLNQSVTSRRSELGDNVEEIPERPESPVVYRTNSPIQTTKADKEFDWAYCTGNSFIFSADVQADTMRASLSIKDFTYDSWGVRAMKFGCVDGLSDTPVKQFFSVGEAGPTGSGSAVCEAGTANGISVRTVANQGCQDNYGIVNVKLFCANQGETEPIAYRGVGKDLGEWSKDMRCPMDSAVCGIRALAASSMTRGSYDKNAQCFNKAEGVGVENLSIACCRIDDPAYLCTPEARWVNIATCEPTRCRFRPKTGMFYLATNPASLPIQFESNGFSKSRSIKTLLQNFEGTIGEDFEGEYYFEMLVDTAISQEQHQLFKNDCKGTDSIVEQLVMTCGFYEVRSDRYRCSWA